MDYEMMVKEAYEEIMGFEKQKAAEKKASIAPLDEFIKEAAGYEEGLKTLGVKQSPFGKLRTVGNVVGSAKARAARTGALAATVHKKAERAMSHPEDVKNLFDYAMLNGKLTRLIGRANDSAWRTQRYNSKLQKELPTAF